MFDINVLLAYVAASAVVAIVPGPSVSLIVANALQRGSVAGLANVAGTQVASFSMIVVLALGLDAVVAIMGEAFVFVKLIGAAYLVYIGVRMMRSDGRMAAVDGSSRSMRGYAVQGFLVMWSNPKGLLFFGAFIPQFIKPEYSTLLQVAVYGGLFMATTTVLDSCYALAAGQLGRVLTRARVRLVQRVSGGLLVLGGLWLASVRRA